MKKLIFRAAIILGLVAVPVLGVQVAAEATGPCGSSYSLIDHYAISGDSFGTVGYLDLYYSSTSKRNCLVVNAAGVTYGHPHYMRARIRVGTSGTWPTCQSVGCDSGTFSFYAGPVYTPSGVDMSHKCVDADGISEWQGTEYFRVVNDVHCG